MSDELDVYDLIAGIRGVDLDVLDRWNPVEAASWSCVRCDGWTSDDPPPDVCPLCGLGGNVRPSPNGSSVE